MVAVVYRGLVGGVLVVVVGCGGATPDSNSGFLLAEPVPRPSVEARDLSGRAIRLSEGERLVQLLGWTTLPTATNPSQGTCAVYGLRVSTAGLEEGRVNGPCPASGSPRRLADAIRFAAPDAARSSRLLAALSDAIPQPRPQADATVSVWLETDRRVIRGHVPQPRWPTPYDEASAARGRAPADLAEVWEAVMYPVRYATR